MLTDIIHAGFIYAVSLIGTNEITTKNSHMMENLTTPSNIESSESWKIGCNEDNSIPIGQALN